MKHSPCQVSALARAHSPSNRDRTPQLSGVTRRFAPVPILVPIWVVCFALGVSSVVRVGAIAFAGLSVENSETYPDSRANSGSIRI